MEETHSDSVEIKWNFPFSDSFTKMVKSSLAFWKSVRSNHQDHLVQYRVALPASYACIRALFLESFPQCITVVAALTTSADWFPGGNPQFFTQTENDFVFHCVYTNWILKWFHFHICCFRLPYRADRSVVMWADRLFSLEEDGMKREKVTHKHHHPV